MKEPFEMVTLTNMCVICDDKQRIVVQKRDYYDGVGVVFPGGHVDMNEPIVDSVIREIFEETGLTIQNPKLCGIKDWLQDDGKRYMVFLFKATQFTGELTSSEEGEVYWVNREQLEKEKLIWNMKEMLEIVESEESSEYFFTKVDGKWYGEVK